jgi:hypothetical protein
MGSVGKLLRVTPGALAVFAPITIQDTQAIYAVNANGGSTGTVSKVPEGDLSALRAAL